MFKWKLFVFVILAAVVLFTAARPVQAIVHEEWAFESGDLSHFLLSARGLGVDEAGNVYIASSMWKQYAPSYRFYIMKFGPDGDTLWTASFINTPSGGCVATDMAVDPQGNVYVTGWGEMPGELYNYVTAKFNSEGQLLWSATYDGPGNYIDNANALAIDQDGNVYVTGQSCDANHQYDYATLKYSPQGEQMWVARYTSSAPSNDCAMDLAVDGDGNVYVTGFGSSPAWPGQGENIVTVMYDSQGQQQWEAVYDGTAHLGDRSAVLKLDGQGNVYVAGKTSDNWIDCDYLTLKYDHSGALQWSAQFDAATTDYDRITDMAVDTDGSVTVTGYSTGIGNITIRYSAEGAQQWIRQHSHFSDYYYHRAGIALDQNHNVYVTGAEYSDWYGAVCSTAKYDAQGDLQWIAEYEAGSRSEGGKYLALDAQDNLIVTGDLLILREADEDHPFLVKYSQSAANLGAVMVPEMTPVQIPASGGSFTYDLQTTNNVQNNLTVDFWWKIIYPDSVSARPLAGPEQMTLPLGFSASPRTQRVPGDFPAGTYQYILCAGEFPGLIWTTDTLQVIKLPVGGSDFLTEVDNALVNPNPFNPVTAISYELSAFSQVKLTVWDTAGRLVETLVEGWQEAGTHSATFDGSRLASGIYMVRLTISGQTTVQKMVLMK